MTTIDTLPIHEVLPQLLDALKNHSQVVLQAPPGAGKTTLVPLTALQNLPLRGNILMLEPRRMAAKNVAQRMASMLDQTVGQQIGYRIRGESKISSNTRIEIVTGGVLQRMLLQDPALERYSLIIFDEFHERNIDSDMGLSLCLAGRELLREADDPLKILLMSATLHGQELQQFLGHDTPLICSEGRSFPVEVHYLGQSQDTLLACEKCVLQALRKHSGDLLVFLPGQKEIHALKKQLEHTLDADINIAPLYGSMSLDQQEQAITPLAANGKYARKVVIATDIAESSLTIEGIRVVIDSGLRREPFFDPKVGMTRLHTVRISKASAVQRAGRAGRMCEGVAYRLWSQEQVQASYSKPEIEQVDLSPLVIQLFAWGANSEADLRWLSPPPSAALSQAKSLLHELGALKTQQGQTRLTAHGIALSKFPSHPRLAHMMLLAEKVGLQQEATLLAAYLSEPGTTLTDLDRLDIQRLPNRAAVVSQSQRFMSLLPSVNNAISQMPTLDSTGLLLAWAYPERIAQKDENSGDYLLANGRKATLRDEQLAKQSYLAVAETGGTKGKTHDLIYSAAALNESLFHDQLAHYIKPQTHVEWSQQHDRFIAETQYKIGAIVLKRKRIQNLAPELKLSALIAHLQNNGLKELHWDEDCLQWQARCELLRTQCSGMGNLPVFELGALQASIETWLAPHLTEINKPSALKKLPLLSILHNMVDWKTQQRINELAPSHLSLPSGRNGRVDYLQNPPVITGKLQEFFGLTASPSVANGSIPCIVHLLSPAGRPLQVTQDLLSFWNNGYIDVKKEMKGRYPKHPWPDDPMQSIATRATKKKLGL